MRGEGDGQGEWDRGRETGGERRERETARWGRECEAVRERGNVSSRFRVVRTTRMWVHASESCARGAFLVTLAASLQVAS